MRTAILGISAYYHDSAAALLVDHWRLIRTRKREDCFRAFRRSHWIGAAVFGGILASTLLR